MQPRHPDIQRPRGSVAILALILIVAAPWGCSKKESSSTEYSESETATPAPAAPADSPGPVAHPDTQANKATEASTAAEEPESQPPTSARSHDEAQREEPNRYKLNSPSAARPAAPHSRYDYPVPVSPNDVRSTVPDRAEKVAPSAAASSSETYASTSQPRASAPSPAAKASSPAAEPAPSEPAASPAAADNPPATPPEYWNAWTEASCWRVLRFGARCDYVPVLKPGKPYHFVLSISSQSLTEALAAQVSGDVHTALTPDENGTVHLKVVPLLTDGSLELPIDAARVYDLTLDLKRLSSAQSAPAMSSTPSASTPQAAAPSTAEPSEAPAPAAPPPLSSPNTPKDLIDNARKFSAGAAQIPILVSDTPMPCAYITLSIWDEALRKPLDSLIVPVQIQTDTAPAGGCKTAYRGDKIVGGFNSLVSLKTTASDLQPIGLHAFVLESPGAGKRSFAVVAVHDGPQPRIYGWETDSVLSDVFTQPNGLLQLIAEARAVFAAGKSTPEQLDHAYAIAATLLREKIFSARNSQGPSGKDAKEALAALQDIVRKSDPPLIVFSRFTEPGRGGADLYYAPLRLFSAAGADFLSKDVELIQPLPLERSSGSSCIGSWTLIGSPAIAEGTDSVAQDDMEQILKLKYPWIREVISDPARLVSYFKGQDPPPPNPSSAPSAASDGTAADSTAVHAAADPTVPKPDTPRAEGLLVLAHHDKDRGLWFATKDPPVIVDGISRQFPVGSVAVLGACSTAGPGAAESLIRHLNERQVDGMIASAFSVDTGYAIHFSYQLTVLLQDAYANHLTPTMAELFSKALAATAQEYEKEGKGSRQQIGLELMLMGNPDLRLCTR